MPFILGHEEKDLLGEKCKMCIPLSVYIKLEENLESLGASLSGWGRSTYVCLKGTEWAA